MSLLRSAPTDGTPWRDLLSAAAVAVAVPSVLGGALLALLALAQAALTGQSAMNQHVIAMALVVSPFQTVAGMILLVPMTAVLLRAGWFGWLPAAGLGLGVGALVGSMIGFKLGTVFGFCVALILRWVLGRIRPMGVGSA